MDLYQDSSGKLINMDKYIIIFSKKVKEEDIDRIKKWFPYRVNDRMGKYLGIPTQFGRSKRIDFNYLVDRHKKKLNGWNEKTLSYVGKIVLIKEVSQAIPIYVMSVFIFPDNLCQEMDRLIKKFWWGAKENDRKISWTKWETLFHRKDRGELGLRYMSISNDALLAKQGWRIITNQKSIIHKCLKAKYFPTSNFWNAKSKPGDSYLWKSINIAKEKFLKGLCWRIENGE